MRKEGKIMFWVADILLVLYLALFLYRGIKRTGTLNSLLNFVKGFLAMIISIGAAFALSFFVFPMFGWIQDMQLGLLDFGHSFAGILKLLNMTDFITHEEIAFYTAIAICTIIMVIPMYFLFRWLLKQWDRFIMWIRKSSKVINIVGGIFGAIVNVAIGAVILLGFYWGFAALDGSGLFTWTNDVLRSGHLTGLVYEYNPLYSLLGEPGCFAETIGNLIKGNF